MTSCYWCIVTCQASPLPHGYNENLVALPENTLLFLCAVCGVYVFAVCWLVHCHWHCCLFVADGHIQQPAMMMMMMPKRKEPGMLVLAFHCSRQAS